MSDAGDPKLQDLPAAVPARSTWSRLPLVWMLPAVVVLVGGFVVIREKLAQADYAAVDYHREKLALPLSDSNHTAHRAVHPGSSDKGLIEDSGSNLADIR